MIELKSNRNIDLILVHCSDSYDRMDIGVEEITKWHTERGFNTIGYHFVIRKDGKIETGRNINIAGAHCRGYNRNSVGICYVGGRSDDDKPIDDRTDAQKKSLAALIINLQAEHPGVKIKGHNELSVSKSCPNFDVQEDLNSLGDYLF